MLTVVPGDGSGSHEGGKDGSPSLIDEIVREGARRMLAEALQAEVDAYIAAHAAERDGNGRRLVVRNGHHQPREVLTSAGAVEVTVPRVNDKRTDPDTGERKRFSSAILPPWCRKTPKITEYLFPPHSWTILALRERRLVPPSRPGLRSLNLVAWSQPRGISMALYMYQASYTAKSMAAQLTEPQNPVEVIRPALEDVGAKILVAGFPFGEYDVLIVYEAPDDVTAASVAMAVAAAGEVKEAKTTRLLSGQEWLDSLRKRRVVKARKVR